MLSLINSVFITELEKDPKYALAVREAKDKCSRSPDTIPPAYDISRIAYTMSSFAQSTSSVDFDVFTAENTKIGMNDMRITNAEANRNNKDNRKQQNNRQRRRRQIPDVQCSQCKTYGHLGSDCTFYPRVWWCAQAFAKDKAGCKTVAEAYRERNSPANKAAERASIHQAFVDATGETGEPDTYSDETLDRYETFLENMAAQANVLRVTQTSSEQTGDTHEKEIPPEDTLFNITTGETPTKDLEAPLDIADIATTPQALQAVTFPPIPQFAMPTFITSDHELEALPDHECPTIQQSNKSYPTNDEPMVRVLLASPNLQSDTGANRHLTDDKTLLVNYKEITPFTIGTINKDSTSAVEVIGVGELPIPTTTGTMERPKVYYSPNASGSVFSPDRYVLETNRYYSWAQHGCPSTGIGAIIFYAENKDVLTTIPLYPRNGLWYMKVAPPQQRLPPPL